MAIAHGSAVLCRWTLYDESGQVAADDGATGRAHLHGISPVWPQVAAALAGSTVGDRVEVVLPDAFAGEAHPLAGQRVTFVVHVLAVRASTEGERELGQVLAFPADLVHHRELDDPQLRALGPLSMVPPYPWGQRCYRRLLAEVRGDGIELGVGLGGTSIYLASQLAGTGRRWYACDTFEGLPEPDAERDNPYFLGGLYVGATSLYDRFVAHVADHGLDDVVVPIRGDFVDLTLPDDRTLGFAHLDSDLYASVRRSLELVWDRLEDGGVLAVDDFLHPSQGVARACADFFNQRGHRPLWRVVFPYSVYCRKGEPSQPRTSRALDGNVYSLEAMRSDSAFVDAVSRCAERAWPGSRGAARSRALADLITRPEDAPDDIYAYWWALADFWTSIAGGFERVEPL